MGGGGSGGPHPHPLRSVEAMEASRIRDGARAALPLALAPAMLAALVVTQTVGGDRALVLDERLAGGAAGVVAIRLRVPLVGVIAVAAGAAALIRLL